jgi:hypothetical protein
MSLGSSSTIQEYNTKKFLEISGVSMDEKIENVKKKNLDYSHLLF